MLKIYSLIVTFENGIMCWKQDKVIKFNEIKLDLPKTFVLLKDQRNPSLPHALGPANWALPMSPRRKDPDPFHGSHTSKFSLLQNSLLESKDPILWKDKLWDWIHGPKSPKFMRSIQSPPLRFPKAHLIPILSKTCRPSLYYFNVFTSWSVGLMLTLHPCPWRLRSNILNSLFSQSSL